MANFLMHRGNQIIDLQGYSPFITITKAEYVQNILTQDLININITSNTALEFFLGDYIIHHNRKFTINQNPVIKKINESRYEYTIEFEGVQYDLLRRVFFNYDTQGVFTDCDFSFTGTINDFAQLIVNNANRNSNIVWNLGFITPNEEVKTLSFSNTNTLSALQTIVQDFGTEFYITQNLDNNTFTINISKVESEDIVFSLSYGFRKGLYSLERTNVSEGQITTRLYAFGSTDNLPRGYRDYSTRLKMPISVGDYIQSQEKIDLYGVSEEVVLFDDIKPSFEGVMSNVVNTSTTNENLFEFVCSTIDFDLNEVDEQGQTKYLIAGTPAIVSVKTGNLAGYEFEIHKYIHNTNKLLVKKIEDERGQLFPDDSTSAFKFQNGDKFTFLNIIMPESYVIEAEQKLHEKAVAEYEKKSMVNISYVLDIDENFLRTYGDDETEMLKIGDLIEVDDTPLNLTQTSRITSLTRDLLKPQKYKAEIADTYEFSITQQVIQDIEDIETTIRTDKLKSKQTMYSGYRRMRELQGLIFDTDGYFDSELIKPYSIETQMLSIGARSQQFTLEDVVFTANYSNNPNRLRCSAGKLIHFNLGDSVREFNISELITTLATNEPYYVYARVNQETNFTSWRVTTDKIKFDSELGYYNFLCMVLHEPNNGIRLKSMLYGSSFIQGREVTTGRIQSIDGKTYFDLDSGEFKGKFTFSNGKDVEEAIENQEIYVEYSVNGTSNWHSTFVNGDLYMRQKKGNGAWSNAIRIVGEQGVQGPQGPQGQSQFIHVRYSANSNGSSMTTSPTLTTVYIGIANTTSSTAPTANTAYTWSKFRGDDGTQGVPGIAGPAGANGQSLYTWVKYADSPTSGMSDYPDGKMYIGLAYNKATATESNNYSDYSWSLMPQNIEIGGRNLLLGSNIQVIDADSYLLKNVYVSENISENEEVTITVWGKLGSDRTEFGIYNSGGIVDMTFIYPADEVSEGVYKASFKWKIVNGQHTASNKYISIYSMPKSGTSKSTIYRVKLERGNKGTDWTPAPEDVQNAIDTAQSSADSANANLANYSNDNVLTALEKKSVQTEWNRIKAEYTNTITSASSVSVSTTALTTSYNALNTYITPLLSNLNSNSNIVGATFRANFKSFYDENEKVLKDVYLKLNSNITAVNNAVISAQNSANTANNTLANIANDNILTASEKQQTLNEWNRIKAEYTANLSLGTTLGVSTASLTSSYNTLNSYITPLLSSLTTNSTIVGTTFRANFNNYYTANVELLKAISVKLQSNIDSIEIGGRNLLLKSNTEVQTQNIIVNTTMLLTPGELYSFSAEVKGVLSGNVFLNPSVSVNLTGDYNNTEDWRRVSLVFTFIKNDYLGREIYPHIYGATNIRNVKLEKGNKATDWTPAPEDVQNAIDTAQNSANTANNLLTQIASDSYLTASEKQQVANEWNRIKSEYTNNLALANSLSVSATSYTSKYNTLNTYITPLIASLTTTSAIVGSTFRNNFNSYYSANIELLKNISLKLQANNQANSNAIAETNAELARAKTALDKATAVTSFLETTVDGNVISTGMMQVGDKSQANAGVSGLKENGATSIRFWAGATAQNRSKAKWSIDDSGFERCYHNNGVLASERGFDGTKWVYNMYNEQGWALFQLDSVRGLVPVSYTDESYTISSFINLNQTNSNYDSVVGAITTLLSNTSNYNKTRTLLGADSYGDLPTGGTILYGTTINTKIKMNLYEYYNGTHPNNAQYESLRGWKTSQSRTTSANGWYVSIGSGANNTYLGYGEGKINDPVSVTFRVVFISNGVITQTKLLTLSLT